MLVRPLFILDFAVSLLFSLFSESMFETFLQPILESVVDGEISRSQVRTYQLLDRIQQYKFNLIYSAVGQN